MKKKKQIKQLKASNKLLADSVIELSINPNSSRSYMLRMIFSIADIKINHPTINDGRFGINKNYGRNEKAN